MLDGEINATTSVSATLVGIVGQNLIEAIVPVVFTASAFVAAPQAAGAIPAEFLTPNDPTSTVKVIQALRERVEIFSRDRGRVEDSFVRVDDLIELGLIKPEDVKKLNIR
jgi:multidrug efflux pump subunit AcrA (membrane-fusion protein)